MAGHIHPTEYMQKRVHFQDEDTIRPTSAQMTTEKPKTHSQKPGREVQGHDLQIMEMPRAHKSPRRGRRGIRKLSVPDFSKPEDICRFIEDKCTSLEEQVHTLVQSESFTTPESQRGRCEVLLKKRQQINSLITQYGSAYSLDQRDLWNARMTHMGAWLGYCQRVPIVAGNMDDL